MEPSLNQANSVPLQYTLLIYSDTAIKTLHSCLGECMQYVPDWHFVVVKCSSLPSALHHHTRRLSSLPMPSFNIHISYPNSL